MPLQNYRILGNKAKAKAFKQVHVLNGPFITTFSMTFLSVSPIEADQLNYRKHNL